MRQVEPNPELDARAKKEREEVGDGRIRPFVYELANRGDVQPEEWAVGMNSYERELLLPALAIDPFLDHVEHCLKNCSRREGVSYDDAVINELAPELVKRLRDAWQSGAALARVRIQLMEAHKRSGQLLFELRRLTRLLVDVVNFCTNPEAGRTPFKLGDTFEAGITHVKRMISGMVLGRVEPREPPVEPLPTFNSFGVTAKEERVLMLMPPYPTLTREDALRLAAWLVVGADLAGEKRSLEIVATTVEAIWHA